MNTARQNIKSLLDRITVMYSVEKVASFLLPELASEGHHLRVKHALMLEAEENTRQCERLEALLNILRPAQLAGEDEESEMDECVERVSELFNRSISQHINIGYDTSILVAEVMGRIDILNNLRSCMMKDAQPLPSMRAYQVAIATQASTVRK
jgi:hypothetical protein